MPLPHRPTKENLALRALIAENLRSHVDLGGYLRKLAQATVLGMALTACGQSHGFDPDGAVPDDTPMDPPPPYYDEPPFDSCGPQPPTVDPIVLAPPITCEPHPALTGQFWNPLPLFAEQGFSFAALHAAGGFYETGVACEGASDPMACQDALDALFDAHAGAPGLFFTRGDEVRFVDDGAEIMDMFGGRITTGDQALFMVYLNGDHQIGCEVHPSGAEETEDGSFRVAVYQNEVVGPASEGYVQYEYLVDATSGDVTFVESRVTEAYVFCGGGRRPAGLVADAPAASYTSTTPVGDLFAQIAHLEESAVAAFEVMIEELKDLGAPEALVEGARAARLDEMRHTKTMGALARAYGVEPARPEVANLEARRTPFAIALENAVEGCVRETYGALVAAHQALHAEDPRIAAAMEVIAEDEIRHAELSWALSGWLEPQLDDAEREAIAQAKREAVAALRETAAPQLHESVIRLAGLPTPDVGAALMASLANDIWA